MATMTSTYRGTVSFGLAPTQNTAPVHEYRCLYTRDLHKKSKKWHDGFLRFHTFNARVMVSDESKNYIGDLHYRQEEEFGEGVEIQLDRGVMVEVGERVGETETDLAPILDRQRPDKTAATHTPRATTGWGFQRPKSLLEVLGPSQGRLGRSRLPLQSPYDQRQTFVRVEAQERPSKRRRPSADKENDVSNGHGSIMAKASGAVLAPQSLPANPPIGAPIVFQEVLDVSSDEDTLQPPVRVTRPVVARLRATKHDRNQPADLALNINPPKAALARPKKNSYKSNSIQNVKNKTTVKAKPRTLASEGSTNRRGTGQKTARLILGQPRHRPTLTCLLPLPSKPSTRRSSMNSVGSALPRLGDTDSAIHVSSSPSISDQHSTPQDDHIQEPCAAMSVMDHDAIHDPEHQSLPHSSPLFVPEESTPPPLSPRIIPSENDHIFPDSNSSQPSAASEKVLSQSHDKPDALTALPEVDVSDDEDHGRLPSEARSPLPLLENLASGRTSRKSVSPFEVPRSALDTTVEENTNDQTEEQHENETGESEIGPWTTEEAFLLFDWWPPAIQKPDYWHDAGEPPAQLERPTKKQGFGGITTARQFLRDDMNVL
jgi:hypothetical protein